MQKEKHSERFYASCRPFSATGNDRGYCSGLTGHGPVLATNCIHRPEMGEKSAVPPLTQRVLKLLGESGLWKLVSRSQIPLYRLSRGLIGHRTAGITNLILTTKGRRSGEPRSVMLSYMADGDAYVIVASNGGASRPPAWWFNLQSCCGATVEVGGDTVEVEARTAPPHERERLWPMLKKANPFYAWHELNADREIAVVILAVAEENPR